MKIRFLYLNIVFAIIYSTLSLIFSESISISEVIKVIMLSGAVIFTGYILDSKSQNSEENNT